MTLLVKEDTSNTYTSNNPYWAAVDAQDRDVLAREQHRSFFEDSQHQARVEQVSEILRRFFKRHPDFITARGVNRRRPFETVKMEWVGNILTRTARAVKNRELYEPLLALENVEVISKNGHLTVRVY